MESQLKSHKNMVRAALTLVLGLCILGAFIVVLGGHRFWESLDNYVLRFHNVKDLSPGRPVKYAGINVGRITSVGVDPDDPRYIRVVVGLEEGFPLYQGTVAKISQKGLVGDNHVLLELAQEPGARLAAGVEIPTEESYSMDQLAASIGDLVRKLAPQLETIAAGLAELAGKENRERIERLLTGAPELIERAGTTLDNIDRELASLSGTAKTGIRETRDTVAQVGDRMSVTLANIDATVGAAHRDWEQTTAKVRGEIDRVATTIEDLSSQLQADLDYDQDRLEEVLDNVNDLTRDLQGLTRSLRERPWQVIYKPGVE